MKLAKVNIFSTVFPPYKYFSKPRSSFLKQFRFTRHVSSVLQVILIYLYIKATWCNLTKFLSIKHLQSKKHKGLITKYVPMQCSRNANIIKQHYILLSLLTFYYLCWISLQLRKSVALTLFVPHNRSIAIRQVTHFVFTVYRNRRIFIIS